MNKEKNKTRELTIDGKVYYDPRTDGLFTVHKNDGEHRVIIGDVCAFYNDAITGLVRYSISQKYFTGCRLIKPTSQLLTWHEFKTFGDSALILKSREGQRTSHPHVYENKEFHYLNRLTNKCLRLWNMH